MGLIVGGLDSSAANNFSQNGSTLEENNLPSASKKNFGKYANQCIGQIYNSCIVNGETVAGSTSY